MKKVAGLLAVVLIGLVAYLSLWPVPVVPVVWSAPAAPGYVGPHAVNTKLAKATLNKPSESAR